MRSIACVTVLGLMLGCDHAPDCKTAATKAVRPTGDMSDGKLVGLLTESCEKTQWSSEIRSCLGAAANDADIDACLAQIEGGAAHAVHVHRAAARTAKETK